MEVVLCGSVYLRDERFRGNGRRVFEGLIASVTGLPNTAFDRRFSTLSYVLTMSLKRGNVIVSLQLVVLFRDVRVIVFH